MTNEEAADHIKRIAGYLSCNYQNDQEALRLAIAALQAERPEYIDVVFDGPPSPDCHFVEVEDMNGKSIRTGEWIKRTDGLFALRMFAALQGEREWRTVKEYVTGICAREWPTLEDAQEYLRATPLSNATSRIESRLCGPWEVWRESEADA